MDRRNMLKAAIVAPFVGLGVKKAAAEQTIKVPWTHINTQIGYIRFKDTRHMIVVDRDWDAYVESIRMVLEELLGESITTRRFLPPYYTYFEMRGFMYYNFFGIDEIECFPADDSCGKAKRRTIAEQRITSGLNDFCEAIVRGNQVVKRLNLNK